MKQTCIILSQKRQAQINAKYIKYSIHVSILIAYFLVDLDAIMIMILMTDDFMKTTLLMMTITMVW